jgi:hypothetical protein
MRQWTDSASFRPSLHGRGSAIGIDGSDRRSGISERTGLEKRGPLGSTKLKEGAMSVVVGIDVGAYKHAAAVCRSDRREAERRVFRYRPNRAGFRELDAWLQNQELLDKVVLESSGHYWLPVASHLQRAGCQVAVVNPLEAKYFAKSRLQRSKSDPADARTLAALGVRDQPPAREPLVGVELREAARFCMRLVEEQAKLCQRIRRLIEIGFPELGEVFEDPICDTAIAVLRRAPTARVAARRLPTPFGQVGDDGWEPARLGGFRPWPGKPWRRRNWTPRSSSR